MKEKNIGIVGSGPVGQALANGFIRYNYNVMIGTRDRSKLQDWQDSHQDKGSTGSFEETCKFGEIIVFAVTGKIAEDLLRSLDDNYLNNKTIIDTTNPIDASEPENGVIRFFTRQNESLMERLQKIKTKANFVKAFNSVGSALMVNPEFKNNKPTMFICGNNENAKQEVASIIEMFGWETEDMGVAEAARAIESLCMLWCIPGFLKNDWQHAFKLLKK